MIKVACLSFSNTFISNFNHHLIQVDYYHELNNINYLAYDIIIILNEQGKVDLIKCLKTIKRLFNGVIYVIDYQYSQLMVEEVFNHGANDYLIYPIKKTYLIQKILKEYEKLMIIENTYFQYKSLYIDFKNNSVYIEDKKIYLTRIEYQLLELLVINSNKTLSKDEIYEKIWGSTIADYRTLETHIKTLRSKLSIYRNNIITIWNSGYSFSEEQ